MSDAVQGTVRRWAAATRDGDALLDGGAVVAFDAAAFDAGGLRMLRPGQRVRLERDPAGHVTRVTIHTLP